ncbi:hypothetical protein T11_1031 [Trichinella zimbabwensis]|uniref:Uncharacterized protein n=1 Tax=Trichinella zimbabwensis TaxID=268475 RepID=A0A0V1HWG4_9BILA|nr:hypothetical protein T11_1031 [Trichinella zimbabwensis]
MNDRKGQNILAIEHQNGKYSQKKIDVLCRNLEAYGEIVQTKCLILFENLQAFLTCLSDLNQLKFIQKMGVDCCEISGYLKKK